MKSYVTLTDASAELTVLRSRFLSFVYHIEGEEEAAEKLAALRRKYYDATHVCYAYVADERGVTSRFSDDGEPSSTAGAPIMSVIAGGEYKKVLVAVVRYFGGTKLGVGGLVKAYTDAAAAAVANASRRTMVYCELYEAETDYNTFGKIRRAAERGGGRITDIGYGDRVRFVIAFPAGDNLLSALVDLTGAKTEFIKRGYRYEDYQM